MLSGIKGYLLKKEIYKIKESITKINLKEVKEDLIPDAKKSVNKLINFLSKLLLSSSNNNIDDIVKDINSKINAFNNEMNSIMKKSIVIPPMVNVMPDLTEDDFYETKTFIENINIKPTVNKNMIEFEVLRYADEYEYTDIYKFRIEENHNITQFYLTDFIEESFEEGTNKITSYSFGKEDINMNDITMLFEIDKR